MDTLRFIISVLLVGLCAASSPRSLLTMADLRAHVQHGTPLRLMIDHTNCTIQLPPQIKVHSFSFEVNKGVLTYNEAPKSEFMEFVHYRFINGSRYNLTGPATRFFEATLTTNADDQLNAFVLLIDFNPNTYETLAEGSVVCLIKKGLTIFAEYEVGQLIPDVSLIKTNLLSGFPVFYNIDLAVCRNNNSKDFSFAFGQIKDFRIDAGSDVAFTERGFMTNRGILLRNEMSLKVTSKGVMTATVSSYSPGTGSYKVYDQFSCNITSTTGQFFFQ